MVQMSEFLAQELTTLGAHVESRPLGLQPGKKNLSLPPVIVARYGDSPSKRNILLYGHYDVQPALKEDGWATDPFTLSIDDQNRMYGRGSTDDKGPVLGWLNAIQAHKEAGIDLPVNLLMCFEGMEEYGSEGLDEFIEKEAKPGGFFEKADACLYQRQLLARNRETLPDVRSAGMQLLLSYCERSRARSTQWCIRRVSAGAYGGSRTRAGNAG